MPGAYSALLAVVASGIAGADVAWLSTRIAASFWNVDGL